MRGGYSVLTAQNAEEAWNLIQANQHEIRLLLTDIVMPDSFDGFELADRVRKHQPDLPILLMTGASLHEYPSADLLAWEPMLLRKPFTPDQLLTFVRENLEAANRSNCRTLGIFVAGSTQSNLKTDLGSFKRFDIAGGRW